jgi:hypothetical protein
LILVDNAISKELLSCLNDEIEVLYRQRAWSLSNHTWDQGLSAGIYGPVASSDISFILLQKIKKELKQHLPSVECSYNYNVWHPQSGIRFHSDSNYSFGATLYLNEWNKKWGGLFIWEDKEENLHCICPTPGLMVINTSGEQHHVTGISPQAPYPRRSLQIFGSVL